MSERFDRAVEQLDHDRSPRPELEGLDEREQRMLRMAQLLRGATPQAVDPGFRVRLQEQLAGTSHGRRVSRRAAFLSGVGALAAGILGGLGLGRLGSPGGGGHKRALVGNHGSWFAVAQVVDVHDGAVRPFTAGAVQGVLIRRGPRIHAVSRICTHMGCALGYQQTEQHLVCPCHGAEFRLDGSSVVGSGGYSTPLPTLPPLRVRTNGDQVEVWAVSDTVPPTGTSDSGWT